MTTMDALAGTLAHALAARPRQVLSAADKTQAAVLVPLLDVDGAPHVLYTRRSHTVPHHRGQVAFPGGRLHAGDRGDLARTALRESHEEIGVRPDDVHLLGALDDIETMTSRFVITPWVGVIPHPYEWRLCPNEVDALFTVPLDTLRAPGASQTETWDFGGRSVPIDAYRIAEHVIWGATERITRSLLRVLEAAATRPDGARP